MSSCTRTLLRGAVVAAVLLASGCGGDDSSDGSSGELVPANEANEAAERDGSTSAEIGDVVEVGDGRTMQVIAVDRSSGEPSSDERAQIDVEIRAENSSGSEWWPHEMNVACANGDSGAWYGNSTYQPMTMQPGTFIEGVLVLGVPADCGDPVLRSEPNGLVTADAVTIAWNVPADTFD